MFAICLGGCYNTGTVVLLPEKDGRDTAVEVKQGKDSYVLDKPYAAVRQMPAGPLAYTSDQKEVDARFGAALAAQPKRAESFRLYFLEGQDELTVESKQAFETVLVEIAKYPVPDVVVVGHTDTVGTDQVNDALARKRAETVKALLVARGVAAADIETVGRGKRELLVKTGDNVAEPQNRRVEILVR
ncbi:MAG TPA: OmpA family protein [Casimicrobiaceae bacterium]|nr:OmpA family protein [Casimicrobiaceae bacterium]